MAEPTITGTSRPQPVYRPAQTQPLDPAALERATTSLAPSGQAKTTPLVEPLPADQKPLPGLFGAVQTFVKNLFGGSADPAPATPPPAPAIADSGLSALAIAAQGDSRLADADPPAGRSYGMVEVTRGIQPAAVVVDPNAGKSGGGTEVMRSWGMVTMDGVPPSSSQNDTPATTGMRSWGMVSMADQTTTAAGPEEPAPQTFRTWGMVGLRDEAPVVVPPAPKPPVTPPVDKPPVTPPVDKPPVTPPVDKPPVTPPVDKPPPSTRPPTVPPVLWTPPLTRPGESLTAEQKSELLARVKGVVSPEVAALLDKLDAEGKLDKKAATGRTALEVLAELSTARLNDSAVSLGYTPKGVTEQTIRDLADPLAIKQDGENDCVWTNLRMNMAKDQPGDYAELALQLYRDAEASLPGGGTIKLEDALKPFDLGGSVGRLWYQDGALWLQYKGFPPMPAEQFVGEFLNNEDWIERMLQKNAMFNNPFVRGLIQDIRTKWNEGKHDEVLEMVAPFVEMYVKMNADDPKLAGLKYAVENFRSLFKPATQAGEALPKGLPLGRVDEFYPGLKGYYTDDTVLSYLVQAAGNGVQIPVAFTTDDGEGLHMATIMGRIPTGEIVVYDPVNGARTMPVEVLRERAAAAFLPPSMGSGLSLIPDTDARPVAGGRFTWRGSRG